MPERLLRGRGAAGDVPEMKRSGWIHACPQVLWARPGFSDSWREAVPSLWCLVIAVLAVMVRLLPG